MRKWIIAVVVVLIVLAGAVAFALSNLNTYLKENKDWLEQQVEAALGREVKFDEVSVSLSGGFGVRVTKLRVADDPAFSKEDFVEADDVQVSVRLWPALFGNYEVGRILLDAPSLTVIRGAGGFNFDSIGKGAAAPAPEPPAAEEAPATEEPPAAAAAFLVSRTEIRGARLRYVDRTVKPVSDFLAEQLDFSASNVSLTSPVELDGAVALFGSSEQNLKVSGTIGPLGAPPDVQSAPLDLRIEVGPVVIDEMKKLAMFAGAIPPEISSADPIRMSVAVEGTAAKVALKTSFDAESAALRYGDSFAKPKGTPMRLDLDATRTGDVTDVKRLVFRLASLELEGAGTIRAGERTVIDFTIDSNRAPLAGWGTMLPALAEHDVSGEFEMHLRAKGAAGGGQTPALSGNLVIEGMNARLKGSPHEIEGLSTRIEFQKDSLTVPPTKFRLGGSPVEVQAKIDSLAARKGTFTLRSPELRAASLGVAGPEVTKEEVIRDLDLSGTFQAPPEKAPEIRGQLRSAAGTLRDIDYQALKADFGLREQVATLDGLALRAFEGSYDGGGRYDMREPESPKFDFRSTVRDMNLKGLLRTKFSGAEEKIEGKLDADLQLAGTGREWEAIQKNLRGDGRINVREGTLKDVNLAEQVLSGVTGIGGLSNLVSPRIREKYPEIFSTGDTRFEKLGGSVQIADGVARTDDVTLAARDYAILGKGTFALENRLDFTATLVGSKRLTDDVVGEVKEAKYITNAEGKLEIPFRLTGSLPNVRPKPDGDFIVKALGRAAVEKGLEKGLDKLFGGKKRSGEVAPGEQTPKPAEEMLRKGLEGLFGR